MISRLRAIRRSMFRLGKAKSMLGSRARAVGMASLIVLLGCHRQRLTGDGARTSNDFRLAVLQVAPLGTPTAEAQGAMVRNGFTCAEAVHAKWGDLSGIDYLHCDRYDGSQPVKQRWQVALIHRDGKIVDVKVTNGLVGP